MSIHNEKACFVLKDEVTDQVIYSRYEDDGQIVNEYDDNGKLIHTKTAKGFEEWYIRNEEGLLIRLKNNKGLNVKYTRNKEGNIVDMECYGMLNMQIKPLLLSIM